MNKMKRRWFVPLGIVAMSGLILGVVKVSGDETFANLSFEEIQLRIVEELGELNAIDSSGIPDKQKAEKLVRLGELSLVPQGFTLALDVFEEALQYDPENSKANFYAAALGPLMACEGIGGRLSYLLPEDATREIAQSFVWLPSRLEEPIRGFLYETSEQPWLNESEVQSWLKEVYLPTIHLALDRIGKVENDERFAAEFDYSPWVIVPLKPILLSVTHARSLKASLKSREFAANLLIAFNLQGAADIYRYVSKNFKSWNDVENRWDEFVDYLKDQHVDFGLIRDREALKNALAAADDALDGLKLIWRQIAIRSTTEADKLGLDPENEMLASSFLSGKNSIVRLHEISNALTGPYPVVIGKSRITGKEVKVVINFPAFFEHPVSDLKSLLPTYFDSARNLPDGFADLTFGGIIPNGDLLLSLEEVL